MKTPKWFLKKSPIAVLLLPFSGVYYLVSRLVFKLRARRPLQSKRKIICVGNIMSGGVGKTPIVREIAKFLDATVVMRGYKKTSKTGNIGDEAIMLGRDGLNVHTGDRKSNIILLNKQKSKKPIVMDDGFQNPGIHKDISVVVIDESVGFGNGFLLPAGPLREPQSALVRADAIIIIKSYKKNKKADVKVPVNIPVFYAENKTISPYADDVPLVAFSGIGYPKKFFDRLNNVVARRAFADHYQYTDEDIKKLMRLAKKRNANLVTTEKDWVRLPESVRSQIKYAKLDTQIEPKFFDWLGGKLNGNVQK